MEAGRFVWIDVDATNPAEALRRVRKRSADRPANDRRARCKNEPSTQHARFDDYIHLVVSGCRQRGGKFDLERVDAVIAERFFLTIHKGPVAFLSAVRRDYRSDFLRFARSPSFLVYELWDHLIDNYLSVQKVDGGARRAAPARAQRGRRSTTRCSRASRSSAPTCCIFARCCCRRARCSPIFRAGEACSSARQRSRSSRTWSERSSTCSRTCWSIATSSPNR